MTGSEILSAYMEQLASSWTHDKYGVAFALIHTVGDNPTVNGFYASDELIQLNDKPQFFIPDPEKRVCRFCGKREPEVHFENKAHAVPEFLGNKHILSHNECDECNARFSEFESNLASYLQPYNSIWGIQGKRGCPKSKTKDKSGWISAKPSPDLPTPDSSSHWVYGEQHEDKTPIFTFNEEKKSVHVAIERPSYIPSLAYKALMKIGLSLLPSRYLPAFPALLEDGTMLQAAVKEYSRNTAQSLIDFEPGTNVGDYLAFTTMKQGNEYATYGIYVQAQLTITRVN